MSLKPFMRKLRKESSTPCKALQAPISCVTWSKPTASFWTNSLVWSVVPSISQEGADQLLAQGNCIHLSESRSEAQNVLSPLSFSPGHRKSGIYFEDYFKNYLTIFTFRVFFRINHYSQRELDQIYWMLICTFHNILPQAMQSLADAYRAKCGYSAVPCTVIKDLHLLELEIHFRWVVSLLWVFIIQWKPCKGDYKSYFIAILPIFSTKES